MEIDKAAQQEQKWKSMPDVINMVLLNGICQTVVFAYMGWDSLERPPLSYYLVPAVISFLVFLSIWYMFRNRSWNSRKRLTYIIVALWLLVLLAPALSRLLG